MCRTTASVSASAVQFWAEGEKRLFTGHRENRLWLVDEFEGRRVYRAEQIGLGRVPNEALRHLRDRRDLGIHSDVITDGVVDLAVTRHGGEPLGLVALHVAIGKRITERSYSISGLGGNFPDTA